MPRSEQAILRDIESVTEELEALNAEYAAVQPESITVPNANRDRPVTFAHVDGALDVSVGGEFVVILETDLAPLKLWFAYHYPQEVAR